MECIHYGSNKRHVFNQEENQPDPQSFLACHMLPSCLSPSVTRHKKLKHPFLLPACAIKIGSFFFRNDKKNQHSHTEPVIGTLFGEKNEHGLLHLVIQMEPTSPPLVVLELASSTDFFMKTIVHEPVQFFLTCVKKYTSMSIWEEWKWTEHANGRSIGDALRLISEVVNLEFLEVIKHVTCGTGVIPDYEDRGIKGEMFYMRAKFERMISSFDAESLSMVRSDSMGCADISICFSRV